MLSITETNRKWWILAAMTASLSLIFIDQTALSVALPPMQRELNLSNITLQWVMNAYLLALAVLVVFGGKLGDLISHRTTFLMGITVFMLSCLTCALATSGSFLILSRVFQGIGGALMIPATGAMLIRAFPDEERGKAIGIYIGIASIFLSGGPIFGGLLTQYLSWRWVFWLNLPPALIAIILTVLAHPKSDENRLIQIDWIGFSLFAISMLCLIVALMEAVNWGWSSLYIIGLLTTSVILLILFLWQEKQHANPFIELALFRNQSFSYSTIILLLVQTAGMGLIFWVIFLQDILGLSPSNSGIATLPIMIPLSFMATVGGILRDKFGARFPLSYGSFFAALSLIWIGFFADQKNYWWIFPGFLMYGLSIPLVIGNCMAVGLSGIQREQHGLASGLLSGARQLGSCLGIAIIASILFGLNHTYLNQTLQQSSSTIKTLSAYQIDGLLAGAAKAKEALINFSSTDTETIYALAQQSFVQAFSHTMYFVAGLLFLCFLIARRMPRK